MSSYLQSQFNMWLNQILSSNDFSSAVAFNFNLYENENDFHIQIVSTSSFDENDEDWACDEIFISNENIFEIPKSIAGNEWKNGQGYSKKLITTYLDVGKKAYILKMAKGVGIGFVDGNLELIDLSN